MLDLCQIDAESLRSEIHRAEIFRVDELALRQRRAERLLGRWPLDVRQALSEDVGEQRPDAAYALVYIDLDAEPQSHDGRGGDESCDELLGPKKIPDYPRYSHGEATPLDQSC